MAKPGPRAASPFTYYAARKLQIGEAADPRGMDLV